MNKVSAIEIYKKTNTNADEYTLMPITSNVDGKYKGEELVNFNLGMLIGVPPAFRKKTTLRELI